MTATIRKPDPDGPRHRKPPKRKRRATFSSMESLGFIETPSTTSTWSTNPIPPRPQPISPPPPPKQDLFADWQPSETSELMTRRVRWGMVTALAAIVAGLALAGAWLWERPSAMAHAALSDVTATARALGPELEGLRELNDTLLDAEIDSSAITAQSLAVDGAARALFNASGELPATATTTRSRAADVATTALDASRLVSDAVAYRSAVIQLLVAPDLETDPDLIGLDEAVRAFGDWQQRFNGVRSALPTGTMSTVSDQLDVISGSLEAIQRRYTDGLRNDDRIAASQALEDLAAQLDGAEATLFTSLEEIQKRARELIASSMAGIDLLLN